MTMIGQFFGMGGPESLGYEGAYASGGYKPDAGSVRPASGIARPF